MADSRTHRDNQTVDVIEPMIRQAMRRPNEDVYQYAWVAVLEQGLESAEDIRRVVRRLENQALTDFLRQKAMVRLDAPALENSNEPLSSIISSNDISDTPFDLVAAGQRDYRERNREKVLAGHRDW